MKSTQKEMLNEEKNRKINIERIIKIINEFKYLFAYYIKKNIKFLFAFMFSLFLYQIRIFSLTFYSSYR